MLQLIKNWWLDNSLFVAIVISAAIVILSLLPSTILINSKITISDKLLHSLAYMSLMWVWMLVFRNRDRKQTGVVLVIVLTFFGIIIEALQGMLTTYRTPDLLDVLADLLGLLLGLVSFQLLYKYIFGK